VLVVAQTMTEKIFAAHSRDGAAKAGEIVEKIFAAHSRDGAAKAGEIVTLFPDIVLLNDISGPVAFQQFDAMGAARPFDPERIVLVADHFGCHQCGKYQNSSGLRGTLRDSPLLRARKRGNRAHADRAIGLGLSRLFDFRGGFPYLHGRGF
jgi:homoaconitase/3-isopropylmalate dehydratase large subunit